MSRRFFDTHIAKGRLKPKLPYRNQGQTRNKVLGSGSWFEIFDLLESLDINIIIDIVNRFNFIRTKVINIFFNYH